MPQSQLAFHESFDYWNAHAISGATLYMALLTGSLFPIGNGVITSASVLSGLTEAAGTGYARASFTLGATSAGVMAIPQIVFSNGAHAWNNNIAAAALCDALTGDKALYCWDLSAVRDMSVLNSTLTIPTLNILLENPGGI